MTDFVQKEENLTDEVSSQVREIPCEEGHCQIGLKRKQENPVFGDIVRLRRSRDEVPSQEELSKESDVTKKLCLQWDRLEVVNEVVYHQRLPGSKLGEEDYLQLLVPKSDVEEVLRMCQVRKK